jgi:GABA permease
VLATEGLDASGELGDFRPLRALSNAVDEFKPDRLVICTHPEARSAWLRYEIVDRARESYPNLPVTHVIVEGAEVTV